MNETYLGLVAVVVLVVGAYLYFKGKRTEKGGSGSSPTSPEDYPPTHEK